MMVKVLTTSQETDHRTLCSSQSTKHVFLLCQHCTAQILLVCFLGKLSVLRVVLKTIADSTCKDMASHLNPPAEKGQHIGYLEGLRFQFLFFLEL